MTKIRKSSHNSKYKLETKITRHLELRVNPSSEVCIPQHMLVEPTIVQKQLFSCIVVGLLRKAINPLFVSSLVLAEVLLNEIFHFVGFY